MGRQEDRPMSLEEAKARFLEEAGRLTPSAWIREHPDAAIGGALAAGFFMGCSPEAQEMAARNAAAGLRLAQGLLAQLSGVPRGRGGPRNEEKTGPG